MNSVGGVFLKNSAVTGFGFYLEHAVTGAAITSGTVTIYHSLDGVGQGNIADTPAHVSGGQWKADLAQGETNGDIVTLTITHADAKTQTITIRTGEDLIDAVWDEDIVAAHGTADTAGRCVRTLDLISDRTNNANLNALLGVADSAGVTVTTQISDVETDTQNIQSRIPAALVSGRMSSDMVALSGSTTAADNLEQGALALVTGAAVGTPTTTVIDTDLTEASNDHYNGRVVTFTSGACIGETRTINDYNGTTKELTTDAFQTAPSATDTFVIS